MWITVKLSLRSNAYLAKQILFGQFCNIKKDGVLAEIFLASELTGSN